MATSKSATPVRKQSASTDEIQDVHTTTCCIVGGGPAGMILALLLARSGVPTMLLEEHTDFDRDFRGDTVHPSTMEIMDELGLADRLLRLRHTKLHGVTLQTTTGPLTIAPFKYLKTKYPYITFMPQADFLDFIAAELQRYACFTLKMGARVEELIEDGGIVRGVCYRDQTGRHTVRSLLTVGADGRFSRVRRLTGIEPIKTSPPMDVLWLRLPREPGDPDEPQGFVGKGHFMALLNRYDSWQAAYIIPKGSFTTLRTMGIDALRQSIAEMAPLLKDRVGTLHDWKQAPLLSVESSRCPRWYKPGLLLIGDAAHVMSPVGGVGINYAIQDAVVAANLLAGKLKQGRISIDDLAAVQRKREWPTRIIQALQTFVQKQIVRRALTMQGPLTVSWPLRLLPHLPIARSLPARIIAFGIWRVHVRV